MQRPCLPVISSVCEFKGHKASHPAVTIFVILDIASIPGTWQVVSHRMQDLGFAHEPSFRRRRMHRRTTHDFTNQRPGLVKPPGYCQRRKGRQAGTRHTNVCRTLSILRSAVLRPIVSRLTGRRLMPGGSCDRPAALQFDVARKCRTYPRVHMRIYRCVNTSHIFFRRTDVSSGLGKSRQKREEGRRNAGQLFRQGLRCSSFQPNRGGVRES